MTLSINVVSGHSDVWEDYNFSSSKKIGYFDEKISAFITLDDGSSDHEDSAVELNMRYDNGLSINCPLEEKSTDGGLIYWVWNGQINPKKACHKLNFKAKYKLNMAVREDVKLHKYQELGLIDFNGVTLCEDKDIHVDEHQEIVNDSTQLQCEYSLNVLSIFRMSMRTVGLNNGKSIACLEISTSKSINSRDIELSIDDITIECDNWFFKPITAIKFPLRLNLDVKLSLAYQIITTDHHTTKPITCIISSTIDSNINIKTNWVTNIDLTNPNSTNHHALQSTASTPALNGLKRPTSTNDKLDLPKFKASKSTPSLRTIKQRSSSHNTVIGASNFDRPAAQRHSSLKQKSGSSISLSSGSLTTPILNKKGLKIKVSGPTNVKVGTSFRWNLELLNQSAEKMELIIYVQSSINKDYEKSFPPIPIQSGLKYDPVPLFNNQQLVRNFYQKFNKSGIISLSNHLRVSLDSGSIFQTELVLVAFEIGLFNLYDLRIVDVASGTLFECGKLLDVLVV